MRRAHARVKKWTADDRELAEREMAGAIVERQQVSMPLNSSAEKSLLRKWHLSKVLAWFMLRPHPFHEIALEQGYNDVNGRSSIPGQFASTAK